MAIQARLDKTLGCREAEREICSELRECEEAEGGGEEDGEEPGCGPPVPGEEGGAEIFWVGTEGAGDRGVGGVVETEEGVVGSD